MAMSIFGHQRDGVEFTIGVLGLSKVRLIGDQYSLKIIVLVERNQESQMEHMQSDFAKVLYSHLGI